jgi:hypothetical protein
MIFNSSENKILDKINKRAKYLLRIDKNYMNRTEFQIEKSHFDT